MTGKSEFVERTEILMPDRQSAELAAAARRGNPGAVSEIPLEFIDDTLGFHPEWVVDKIAPRPVLFITTDNDRLVPPDESEALYRRAGEPKKLVVLHGLRPLRGLHRRGVPPGDGGDRPLGFSSICRRARGKTRRLARPGRRLAASPFGRES